MSEGDKLEEFEKDGLIYLMPVVMYPKKPVNELHNEIAELKEEIKSGKTPVFSNIDSLFESLEKN